MFSDVLPHVANLYCSAGSICFRGIDLSATGLGNSLDEANALRDAEFAERKSFILGPADLCFKTVAELKAAGHHLAGIAFPDDRLIESIRARVVFPRAEVFFPRQTISGHNRSVATMAEGTAAGIDPEMALLNAMLEVIERHASRRWWQGGCPPLMPSNSAAAYFDRLQRLWTRNEARPSGLLDITPQFGIPVFVAWSCQEDGRDLCFGTACRLQETDAVRAALKELFQMEFGLDVIHFRQRNGAALVEKEKAMLARASRLNLDDCTALLTHGDGPSRPAGCPDCLTSLQLAQHLCRFGIHFYAVDLLRTDDIHWAVHAFSSDVQQSGDPGTERRGAGGMPWSNWDLY
jgi:ribosomal protein S12 methylthiotransferase accessory factor YcaO